MFLFVLYCYLLDQLSYGVEGTAAVKIIIFSVDNNTAAVIDTTITDNSTTAGKNI